MGEPLTTKKTKDLLIAVCVKQVDYIYGRSGQYPNQGFIDSRDRVRINNPADEEALELAVRLKEKEKNAEVWVFSLGMELISQEVARTLAIGADRFVWLTDPSWAELGSRGMAIVLAAAVKAAGADLILCGAAALDTGRGEVGPFISYHLGLSFVPAVQSISMVHETKRVLLQNALGRGDRLESVAALPLVMSVSQGTVQPRYPSHVRLLVAGTQKPLCWGPDTLSVEAVHEKARVPNRETGPRPRVKSISPPDGELQAFERVRRLLSGSGGQKAGVLLQGDAPLLAKSLVAFLRQRGFWRETPPDNAPVSPQ